MSNSKRAQEEDVSRRPLKARRSQYVTLACDECKRRKVKCSGQIPCEKCRDWGLSYSYQADNRERSKESQLFDHLSSQIQTINSKLDMLTSYVVVKGEHNGIQLPNENLSSPGPNRSSRQRRRTHSSGILDQPQSLCPGFRGPTSSSFIFEVAKDSLEKMGLNSDMMTNNTVASHENVSEASTRQQSQAGVCHAITSHHDTILDFSKEEVLKLCQDYDHTLGTMYPVLDMLKVLSDVHQVYALPRATLSLEADRNHLSSEEDDPNFEINIIKLICAVALASAGYGEYKKAQKLYDDVRDSADTSIWDAMGIRGLQYLTLVALYHVQIGQDVRASRIIGLAARLCLEMGLNRHEVLIRTFPVEQDRSVAVRIFWSIYTLDMRASCGTGIPFIIQDIDLDPTLPEPDDSFRFAKTMIGFARLSGKVWRMQNTTNASDNSFNTDDIDYFDYRVLQWQRGLPEPLRYSPLKSKTLEPNGKQPLFIRAVTFARINQLRNLIYRRVLYSRARLLQHMAHGQTVLDVAKSTVSFLSDLNSTTELYRAQPVIFNHFLVSALGIILLAAANAPDLFSQQCRGEYYTALRLLKESAAVSPASMRLWKTVKGLERLGPTLGLVPPLSSDTNVPDVYQPDQFHGGSTMVDLSQNTPTREQSPGFRDDLVNLFGFTPDVLDRSFLFLNDFSGGNPNNAQLGNVFGGAELG